MPTYGYQCTRCENAFEVVQKITDAPLSTCDDCGGELRKKIFPVGIQFKGAGFYVNDYAKSSGSAAAGEAKTSAETKPADPAPDTTPAPAAPVATDSKPAAAAS